MDIHHDALGGKHRILESGCGSGNFAIELLEQGHEVHAVDRNNVALERLRAKSKGYENKLKIYCKDVNSLPFDPNFFDGVSSMLVLPFMDSPVEYLKGHERVMKPRGIMVVSGPDIRAKNEIDWMMMQWKEDIIGQGGLRGLGKETADQHYCADDQS